jgi:polyisoprenyl-phosphate glycosyltransferase
VRTRTLSLGHFRRYWYLRTCGNHIGFVYSFQDFGRSKRSLSPESVGTWPWRRSNGMNQVLVLAPIFDDWESATRLLGDLDRVAATIGSVEVVLVDDGSNQPQPPDFAGGPFPHLLGVRIIHLARNLGHQRALAVGLVWAAQNSGAAYVIVMDGDGEDRPEDVPLLLAEARRHGSQKVVFAARAKRLERAWFQVGYHTYRLVHYLLTGVKVRVGNFSVVPAPCLQRLALTSEIWNHYAASIYRTRIPHVSIPLSRGSRYAGRSKMNLVSLVLHGLAAISVFIDVLGARLLVFLAGIGGLTFLGISAIVAVRLFSSWAIPGWATTAAGLLSVILLQTLTLMLMFVFVILSTRSAATFMPTRDCPQYIREIETRSIPK